MKHFTEYITEQQQINEGLIRDVVMKTLDALFNGISKVFDAGFKWMGTAHDDVKSIVGTLASGSSKMFKRNAPIRDIYEKYFKDQSKTKNFKEFESNTILKIKELTAQREQKLKGMNGITDAKQRNELQQEIKDIEDVLRQISISTGMIAVETNNHLSSESQTQNKTIMGYDQNKFKEQQQNVAKIKTQNRQVSNRNKKGNRRR